MPPTRRFPPPWTIDEMNAACFIVRDKIGQALGLFLLRVPPVDGSLWSRSKAPHRSLANEHLPIEVCYILLKVGEHAGAVCGRF
jgi:hypothetical protein